MFLPTEPLVISCPVCGQNLAELGAAELQEAHVKACLEGPRQGSAAQQPVKYLVYRLPAESALIGVECVICLEEFVRGVFRKCGITQHIITVELGSLVARLSCLCSFHSSGYFKRLG